MKGRVTGVVVRGDDKKTGLTLHSSGRLHQRPIPELLPQQVRRFTAGTLRARPVRRFDTEQAAGSLRASDGKPVLAVDIGGDKIAASCFTVRDGAVQRGDDVLTRHGDDGAGYLAALTELSGFARRLKVPVGISFAGPTNGTRLLAAPNLPLFIAEFRDRYDGDFANLFHEVELANDAEAGIMAAALEAARRYPGARDLIYIINGSGLGGSVLTGNMIYAAEPGHIEVADRLNAYGQRKSCGLAGAGYVCVEVVAASKAGVEDIWFQRSGEHLSGQEISARYLAGDRVALGIYDNSALVTAHVIKGMAVAFGLLGAPRQLVVAGHGGIFQVPGYGERLRTILGRDLRHEPQMLFTKDFSANTCLEGAAIAIAGRSSDA
jgi:predicted NBD/HSP70 family sugar kinase